MSDDDDDDADTETLLGGVNHWLMQIFGVLLYIAGALTVIALFSMLTYCHQK